MPILPYNSAQGFCTHIGNGRIGGTNVQADIA
jgi:hypothetical protein